MFTIRPCGALTSCLSPTAGPVLNQMTAFPARVPKMFTAIFSEAIVPGQTLIVIFCCRKRLSILEHPALGAKTGKAVSKLLNADLISFGHCFILYAWDTCLVFQL